MGSTGWGDAEPPRRAEGEPAGGPYEGTGCSCLGSLAVLACAVLTAVGYVAASAAYVPGAIAGPLYGGLTLMFVVPAGIVTCGLWLWVGNPSRQVRRAVGVAVALVLCAGLVLSWAPWDALKTYRTAEIVGIVAGVERDPAGVTRVALADGRAIDLWVDVRHGQRAEAGWHVTLQGGERRTVVGVGELLLAGENPSPWFTTAHPRCGGRADGYEMGGTTGVKRAATIDLDSGLRLPKAPDFARGTEEGPFGGWPCLNAQGQVISIMGYY